LFWDGFSIGLPFVTTAHRRTTNAHLSAALFQRHRRGGAASGRHKRGKCRRVGVRLRSAITEALGIWQLSPPTRIGLPPHEHAALTLFDPGSATSARRWSEYRSLAYPARMCTDDAQSRFIEPSNFSQKPYAAAPAAWRSSPPCAAPRRASADLVTERCDAAIGPELGEKRKRAACA
jgi:hypothetical protein